VPAAAEKAVLSLEIVVEFVKVHEEALRTKITAKTVEQKH
jgi:hypothetical protein